MNNDVQAASRIEMIAALTTLGLRVISARLVTIVTLLLNTGIVTWAMFLGSWVGLGGAAVFAVTSWCVVNLKPSRGHSDEA